ncbi:RDD family protein [Microbacterium sp. MPKO10]|uniref:RDD family protein n=1 Tax=Microbacterium sp. MPKO10 TaxID=2989818 RepID=UPI002235DECC|nr:RDD family protein [Microbacterium sp. MPKO10]MCW4458978.1 RDD family protein [Microbacterium sp. MPKO10]
MTVADGRRARREAEQRVQTLRDPVAEKAAERARRREEYAEALLSADQLGVVAASAGRRSMAYLMDIVCYLIVASPGFTAAWFLIADANWARPGIEVLTKQPNFLLLSIVMLGGMLLGWIFILVEVGLHGLKGVTIGRALAGIRSVSVVKMRKPGFWRIVLRTLILQAANVVLPLLGPAVFLSSSLWSDRGIGWLDRVSKSRVIDIRLGLNPMDLKALRRAERRIARPERVVETDLPALDSAAADSHFAPGERSRLSVVGENPILPPGDSREEWAPGARPAPEPPVPSVPAPAVAESAPPASSISEATVSASAPAPAPIPEPTPAPAHEEASDGPVPQTEALEYVVEGAGVSIGITEAPAIVGRNPEAQEGERVNLVAVNDPSHSMSKTHALFGAADGGVWVEDRGSSNGTVVVHPDGSEHPVAPFVPTWLSGSVVKCGDCEFRVLVKGVRS